MSRSSTTGARAPARAGRSLPLGLLCLLVAHLVAGSMAIRPPDRFPATFETDLARITELVSTPGRHWRDVDVEYPPLLVAELELIGSADIQQTGARLALSQLVLHLGVVAALAWGWGRRGATAYLAISLPLVAYPFVFQRTDLLAVALAAGGAAAWRRRNDGPAAALLALAFFAKAWPVVLGPGLAVTGRLRAALLWAGGLAVGTAAWIAYGGVDALSQVLTFRGATGAQIESLPANVIGLVSDAAWRVEEGAVRVGDLPAAMRLGLPVLGLSLVGVTWLLVLRRHRVGARDLSLGVAAMTAVLALLCTATLLSTQFTSWLLPFAAIVAAELPPRAGWTSRAVRLEVALVALAVAVAAAAGPLMWIHPDVGHGEPGLWLLTVRNLALLAMLGLGMARLALLEDVASD